MKSAFMLCAPRSGEGKTTATLAILAALRARGLQPRSFKSGPDFIDPSHHSLASGFPSENLDPWMMPAKENKSLLARAVAESDVCAIEGAMGLYDGVEGKSSTGSAAHLACSLNLPIVLIIDAKAMARSSAALVYGLANFEPGLKIIGVIWNRVGSPKHRGILDEALASAGLPPSFGAIPRDAEISIPERHLGLVTPQDAELKNGFIKKLAELGESQLDLDGLLAASEIDPAAFFPLDIAGNSSKKQKLKIAVARDSAYCFYYEDALRRIENLGEAVFFRPTDGDGLPPDADGVYLGGGYPEAHAERIAKNEKFLNGLREAHAEKTPIYAECGGLMTLCLSIEDLQGRSRRMAGIFPARAKMKQRPASLGYREVEFKAPADMAGLCARGHEFHYSTIDEMPSMVERIYRVRNARGENLADEGFMLCNTLGSYVHLHFASNPELPGRFFQRSRDNR